MDTLNLFATNIFADGLTGLKDTAMNDWITPLFIVGVAVFAIIFIKDRKWMQLIGFVGIAAIVGGLVFGGDSLFGSDGNLSGVAEDYGGKIQVVDTIDGQ